MFILSGKLNGFSTKWFDNEPFEFADGEREFELFIIRLELLFMMLLVLKLFICFRDKEACNALKK